MSDDHMRRVVTDRDNLIGRMQPVYYAAMAASEAWANKFKQNHSHESRQLFEDAMDTLAILCRRAEEMK